MSGIETIKKPGRNRKGIALKTLSVIIAVTTTVVSICLLIGVYFTFVSYKDLVKTSKDYVSWQQQAEKMLVASDYLTEEVRLFVETGDKAHMNNYFYEAEVTKTRDNSLSFIKSLFPDSSSYRSLIQAMIHSVLLMNTEYKAMRLKCEAMGDDLSTYPHQVQEVELTAEEQAWSASEKAYHARDLLFNDSYISQKNNIRNNTQICLDKLVDEMDSRQNVASMKLRGALIFEMVMVVAFIGLSVFVVVMTSSQVFDPLIRYIPFIENDAPLPVQGAHELRILAETYNMMYEAHRKNRNILKFKADHDALTGALNRRAFDKLQTAADEGKVAFLMIDVDNFKQINDTCGHLAGDNTLLRVVSLLRDHFRSDDSIFRIGGDEFAVVMFGVDETGKDLIVRKVEEINEILAAERTDENVPLVSISVGVAFGNLIDKELISQADSVLYERKKSGKGGCSFYNA